MSEYKEECFKRFENAQKYKNYNIDELIDEIFDLHKKLEQYKNNWEELKKGLEQEWLEWKDCEDVMTKNFATEDKTILNKMKELEEDK